MIGCELRGCNWEDGIFLNPNESNKSCIPYETIWSSNSPGNFPSRIQCRTKMVVSSNYSLWEINFSIRNPIIHSCQRHHCLHRPVCLQLLHALPHHKNWFLTQCVHHRRRTHIAYFLFSMFMKSRSHIGLSWALLGTYVSLWSWRFATLAKIKMAHRGNSNDKIAISWTWQDKHRGFIQPYERIVWNLYLFTSGLKGHLLELSMEHLASCLSRSRKEFWDDILLSPSTPEKVTLAHSQVLLSVMITDTAYGVRWWSFFPLNFIVCTKKYSL